MPSDLPRHHKPIKFAPAKIQNRVGGEDPAVLSQAAHESAQAILGRGRANTDPAVTARLVEFTDHYGLEAIAEMWSHSAGVSLPGSLWRMYALRDTIRKNPERISYFYGLGMESDQVSRIVAGVADPPTESEIIATVNAILTGAYTGEFDIALERFAAFCRVVALGQDAVAHSVQFGQLQTSVQHPKNEPSAEVRREGARRAHELRAGAQRLTTIAQELEASAEKWREGTLD